MSRSRPHIVGLRDRIAACLALLLVLTPLGCGDRVTAPEGLVEPFSMYGILNPKLDTQTLLVSPITNLLEPLGDSVDAVVTSTDLASGATYTWRDSVVTNGTGNLDHIFWTNFRPNYGSRHRIEVRRSDGATSSVEVEVPGRVRIEHVDTGTRYLIVSVKGENARIVQFDVSYFVRLYDAASDVLGPLASYTFRRTGEDVAQTDGYRVDINLSTDYESAKSAYFDEHGLDNEEAGRTTCIGLGLFGMKVRLTVGTADWDPPGGTFDPDALSFPETMTNVENGYGFVGGGFQAEHSLSPSAAALADTWFFDFTQDRRPQPGDCGKSSTKTSVDR